jgi:hypothetical protein
MPHIKVLEKCPVRGSSAYLNSDEVNRWSASFDKLVDCFNASECSDDDAHSYIVAASESTSNLELDAHVVSQWGLVRRAKYEVTHLY